MGRSNRKRALNNKYWKFWRTGQLPTPELEGGKDHGKIWKTGQLWTPELERGLDYLMVLGVQKMMRKGDLVPHRATDLVETADSGIQLCAWTG